MRCLIIANAGFTGTGYGTQVRNLTRIFKSLGHELAILCTYGLQGGILEIEGVTHYPTFRENWGQDVVGHTVKHFGADVCFQLHDAWVNGDGYQQAAGVPLICYSPIDSVPAAPRTIQVMRQARWPVTYSKFGYEEAKKAGLETDYIPHCIDTDIFCPGDKGKAREKFGLPLDAFVVSMVGANKGYPSRKAFPEQLSAFAEFRKSHPSAVLFLHTQKSPVGHWSDGIYFEPLLKSLGLNDGCVFFTNEILAAQGLFSESDVADIYRASDVLLHASYAEGFGLCIVEAQACGCPVITTNFSSMPELTFNGIATEPLQRAWSLLNCWQTIPDVKAITAALERVYSLDVRVQVDAARIARDKIQSDYSIPAVTPMWKEFLSKVEEEVSELKAASAGANA